MVSRCTQGGIWVAPEGVETVDALNGPMRDSSCCPRLLRRLSEWRLSFPSNPFSFLFEELLFFLVMPCLAINSLFVCLQSWLDRKRRNSAASGRSEGSRCHPLPSIVLMAFEQVSGISGRNPLTIASSHPYSVILANYYQAQWKIKSNVVQRGGGECWPSIGSRTCFPKRSSNRINEKLNMSALKSHSCKKATSGAISNCARVSVVGGGGEGGNTHILGCLLRHSM